jgi:hypothetical protein
MQHLQLQQSSNKRHTGSNKHSTDDCKCVPLQQLRGWQLGMQHLQLHESTNKRHKESSDGETWSD